MLQWGTVHRDHRRWRSVLQPVRHGASVLLLHPDAEQVKPEPPQNKPPKDTDFEVLLKPESGLLECINFPSCPTCSVMNENAAIKAPYLQSSPRMSLESLRSFK